MTAFSGGTKVVRLMLGAGVLAGVLTSCTAAPQTVGAQLVDDRVNYLRAAPPDVVRAPPNFLPRGLVQFDQPPTVSGDNFTSVLFPDGQRDALSVVEVGADGRGWQIDTNPSCVGRTSTTVDGQTLDIILDSDASFDGNTLATRTVATAFHDDGEIVWGPVEVPGPHRGPGLIFADTPKSVVSNEPVGAVMLDARTGQHVDAGLAEKALYEGNGVGVAGTLEDVMAFRTGDGVQLWDSASLARPAGTGPDWKPTFIDATGTSIGNVLFFRWTDAGGHSIVAAHRLEDGANLGVVPGELAGRSVIAARESTVYVRSKLNAGESVVTAISPQRGLAWSVPFTGETVLASAGDGMVYLRHNGEGAALKALDGSIALRGAFAVPVAVLPDGTALIPTGEPYEYALASPQTP